MFFGGIKYTTIGIDFVQVRDANYLVGCDYHTKFVELITMTRKDALAVTEALMMIFKSHGLPRVIMSDNKPPFDSTRFKQFLKDLGIDQVTSSPGYSQSNGMIERHIQTIKAIF